MVLGNLVHKYNINYTNKNEERPYSDIIAATVLEILSTNNMVNFYGYSKLRIFVAAKRKCKLHRQIVR